MSNRRRTLAGVVLLVLLSMIISSPYLLIRAQSQIVTIGVIGPVDGSTLHGVSLAVDQVNAANMKLATGVVFNLSVAIVDASADQVPAAVSQLKDRGVAAIFGPDDNSAAVRNLQAMSAAGIPIFTSATSADVRPGGFVFRTQASDTNRMLALVDSLVNDAKASRIAVFQGNADAGSQARSVAAALAMRGISVSPVLQDEGRPVAEAIPVLLQGNPDTIIAFGPAAMLADLYKTLRSQGFAGNFATDLALDHTFVSAVPVQFRNNIYGVTGWMFASDSPASTNFLRAYVSTFGEVPDAQAAAAYDAVNLLARGIAAAGIQPAAILQGIVASPAAEGVQGTINPALGGGELTANVQIIRTNETGVAKLIARFDGKNRITLSAALPPTPVVPVLPTLAAPTAIPATATPQGVVATVVVPTLNVRYGPGLNYDPPIGKLPKDTQVQLLGTEPGYRWFVINFEGRQAWISGSADNVTIFGDIRSLPLVPVPPSPTPPPTAITAPTAIGLPTSTNALPTLKLVSWSLSPNPIKLGQGFTLTVTIANTGQQNAGTFAVAATFDPGGKYAAYILQGLNAGQQVSFQMAYAPLVGNAGTYNVAIVIDLNSQVAQSAEGQASRVNTISYQVVN